MPSIMAKVRRSRRICTNSLRMTAPRRDREKRAAMRYSTFARCIRLMKTSSRLVSVFCQRYGPSRKGRRAFLQLPGIVAADVQDVAEGDHLLDAGQRFELLHQLVHPPAGNGPGGQPGGGDHLLGRAGGEQFTVGEIGQAMAALGFIHVVGADQRGDPLGGQGVDIVPEIAARLRIDPRRRFVEQQQLRIVQQAGGKRQALLPAAGQGAGELAGEAPEPHALERLLDDFPTLLHAVNARHEIEIFADAEILVQTEALCHVADVRLDFVGLGEDVVAETGAAPGIGAQQPAEHADEGRLAAAVRTEKPVNLPALDLQGEVLHHGFVAEGFGQALNGDDGI